MTFHQDGVMQEYQLLRQKINSINEENFYSNNQEAFNSIMNDKKRLVELVDQLISNKMIHSESLGATIPINFNTNNLASNENMMAAQNLMDYSTLLNSGDHLLPRAMKSRAMPSFVDVSFMPRVMGDNSMMASFNN